MTRCRTWFLPLVALLALCQGCVTSPSAGPSSGSLGIFPSAGASPIARPLARPLGGVAGDVPGAVDPPPPALPARRTHAADPLASRIGPPRPSVGLSARNGAIIGGLTGAWAGLAMPHGTWTFDHGAPEAGERAALALFYGALGAGTGAALGALEADPRDLLWPLEAAGVIGRWE